MVIEKISFFVRGKGGITSDFTRCRLFVRVTAILRLILPKTISGQERGNKEDREDSPLGVRGVGFRLLHAGLKPVGWKPEAAIWLLKNPVRFGS